MSGGTVFKFYSDLDTDQIIVSQYLLLSTTDEMRVYTLESLNPDSPQKVEGGDYAVGGENSGCGFSGEQTPSVLKALDVKVVVAKSFVRIFYRNSVDTGPPAIVCKELPDGVEIGDAIELSLSEGVTRTNGKEYPCIKLSGYVQDILNQGGLIASLNEEEAQPWE